MNRVAVYGVALALAGAGCAGANGAAKPAGAATTPKAQGERTAGTPEAKPPAKERDAFPLPAALDRMAQGPRPARIFPDGEGDPESLELQDLPRELPAQADRRPGDPFEELLANHAARSGGAVRMTEPMACLAAQVGRFVLAREVQPGPATLSFLASRCGVADTGFGTSYVLQPLRGGETDAALFDRLRAQVDDQLDEALGDRKRAQTAGLWFGRSEQKAIVLFVHVQPLARLDAFPARGADGALAVTGELVRPAVRLHALITRGKHGFRTCELDPAVALPRFRIRCELDPADAAVALEVAAFEENRIFGPVVVSARVWPRGDAPRSFVRPVLRTRAPADPDLPVALVATLNRVRAEAGLAPVSLVREQSQTAAALAPRFFGAMLEHDDAAMETIVLGLRAGWQVPGLVRDGRFTAVRSDIRSDERADAARLVALALDRPSGREALLDPGVRAVAVGTVKDAKAVGALFATYALVEPAQAQAEADAVLRRIDAARAKRGKNAARPLPEVWREAAAVAAAIERGDKAPKDAVQDLMDAAKANVRGGYVRTWIGSGETLDRVELPAFLVEPDELRVAVAVAHWRAEGSPWVRYCVLAVSLDPFARKGDDGKK